MMMMMNDDEGAEEDDNGIRVSVFLSWGNVHKHMSWHMKRP